MNMKQRMALFLNSCIAGFPFPIYYYHNNYINVSFSVGHSGRERIHPDTINTSGNGAQVKANLDDSCLLLDETSQVVLNLSKLYYVSQVHVLLPNDITGKFY